MKHIMNIYIHAVNGLAGGDKRGRQEIVHRGLTQRDRFARRELLAGNCWLRELIVKHLKENQSITVGNRGHRERDKSVVRMKGRVK